MEVKVNLVALVLVGLQRGKSAVLRSLSPVVSAVLAIVPLTPTPTFSPFSSSTGTMLILAETRMTSARCSSGLRDRRLDGEFFATSSVDAVQLRNAGQVGIEFKTGFFTHGFPVRVKGSGRAARPACYQQLVSSSSPVPPLESSRRGWRWLSVLSRGF
jgi:hypothetical protein